MAEMPSYSGDPSLSWLRCPECGKCEPVWHGGEEPNGELVGIVYDFDRVAERLRGRG